MATTERLKDFDAKPTPVGADIIYMGDSTDDFNEVQVTVTQFFTGYSAALVSIAGLTTSADKMIYTTASNVYATTTLTSFARTILDDTTAAAMRVTLGLPALTNGQLWIGSTGLGPVAATLTAGAGISISQSAGGITIAGTGSGIGWTEVTGTTQTIVADSGYVANNAGLVTFTLPATAAFGTAINIIGKGAGGWAIAQNASQQIQIGSVGSTAGVGGSIASTNRYDSIELICTTTNLVWTCMGAAQGNITIV